MADTVGDAADAAGCRIVSGLDLLLAQAVRQFEQFTGVTAPRAAMAAALTAARAIPLAIRRGRL